MHRTLLLLLWLPALGSFFGAAAQSKNPFDGFKLVDKNGNIRKPADYRDKYQMIGAYTRPRSKRQPDALTRTHHQEQLSTIGRIRSSPTERCWLRKYMERTMRQ